MSASSHIVLLGDSIFDNGAYTRGQPDVAGHLRRILPKGAHVTLLAVDGATIARVDGQLSRVPDDATHLLVSAGGNDALGNIDLLNSPVRSTAEALRMFAGRVAEFELEYRRLLARVAAAGRAVVVCTVYNGALDASIRDAARLALALFNDAILRAAMEHGVDVIDLRTICFAPHHYANPIEPSGEGGLEIARAIARATSGRGSASRLWGGER